MKPNLITLAISLAVLSMTLVSSRAWLAEPSAYTHYYITAAVTISGMLAAISLLRLLMMWTRRPAATIPAPGARPDQRRANFRLTYAQPPRPLFMETKDDPMSGEVFTCPVRDISETGLSLLCTGVYATDQTIHGEVIFNSGRTVQINGSVIREESDRTCLSLHCTIDPSLLMAEQRDQIESQKGTGPRPAVAQSTLQKSGDTLPSHRPKGICRIR